MPLLIRPVKMNKSIYVRVPNDIAHIIGLDNQVEVSFSFEDNNNQLRLIYSLNKSKTEKQGEVNSTVDTKRAISTTPPIQTLRASEVREENGTKGEIQRLPER